MNERELTKEEINLMSDKVMSHHGVPVDYSRIKEQAILCIETRAKLDESEAGAAGMRGILEKIIKDQHCYLLELSGSIKEALATNAGKELLEKMAADEMLLTTHKRWLDDIHKALDMKSVQAVDEIPDVVMVLMEELEGYQSYIFKPGQSEILSWGQTFYTRKYIEELNLEELVRLRAKDVAMETLIAEDRAGTDVEIKKLREQVKKLERLPKTLNLQNIVKSRGKQIDKLREQVTWLEKESDYRGQELAKAREQVKAKEDLIRNTRMAWNNFKNADGPTENRERFGLLKIRLEALAPPESPDPDCPDDCPAGCVHGPERACPPESPIDTGLLGKPLDKPKD